MEQTIVDRRNVLRWVALGSLAVPAVLLAGCATGVRAPRPRRSGGGGTDKSGNNGGMGGQGSR